MPAVGPVVGGVKLTVAPPLIIAVGQLLIVLEVKINVTPVPVIVAPPFIENWPPSRKYVPGLSVTLAPALSCIPPQYTPGLIVIVAFDVKLFALQPEKNGTE